MYILPKTKFPMEIENNIEFYEKAKEFQNFRKISSQSKAEFDNIETEELDVKFVSQLFENLGDFKVKKGEEKEIFLRG